MAGEAFAVFAVVVADQVFGQVGEARVEEVEEGTEGLFLARVGRGGDEEEMAPGILGEVAQ